MWVVSEGVCAQSNIVHRHSHQIYSTHTYHSIRFVFNQKISIRFDYFPSSIVNNNFSCGTNSLTYPHMVYLIWIKRLFLQVIFIRKLEITQFFIFILRDCCCCKQSSEKFVFGLYTNSLRYINLTSVWIRMQIEESVLAVLVRSLKKGVRIANTQ